MDITIGWTKFEPKSKIGENEISVEVRPLKNWAWLELLPLMQQMIPKNTGESTKDYLARLSPDERASLEKESINIQRLAKTIFPEHVRNFQGVTVNGEPPTPEQLSEEVIFMGITIEIMMHLITISNLGEGDLKNSSGPSISQTSDNNETS